MPIPEPISIIGGASAALVAIASAFRKVIVPMYKGMRNLAKAHEDVIEGARLARNELSHNHGKSIKDAIEQTRDLALRAKEEAEEAKKKAEENEDKVHFIAWKVKHIHDEQIEGEGEDPPP